MADTQTDTQDEVRASPREQPTEPDSEIHSKLAQIEQAQREINVGLSCLEDDLADVLNPYSSGETDGVAVDQRERAPMVDRLARLNASQHLTLDHIATLRERLALTA